MVKIALVMLSFLKIVNLLRVFEDLSFKITVIATCMYDLGPFICCYFAFNIFFSMCYASLGSETDGDLEPGHGLGYFGRLVLSVWRNSVGKLSFAVYPTVFANSEPTMIKNIHIFMIYMVYFTQIMWMFTMMLNFMIAVIEETYADVEKVKGFHITKNKAQLNL